MSLAYPYALLFAVPLAFAAWRLFRRGRRTALRFSAVSRIPARSSGWRTLLATAAPWLLAASLVLAVSAAARPRSPLSKDSRSVDAIAIAMAVDVSGSMSALDLTPRGVKFSRDTTRLAVVKKTFADFIAKRPDDLVGLVTFGSFASSRVPLTADHQSLLAVLSAVEIPEGDGEAETAIGDGLSVALLRVKEAKPKSKIVILLSDGMSNDGIVSPDEATEMASRLGVKVYTIGVGTGAPTAPRLFTDIYGREYVRNVPSAFDESQLRDIARKTGGRYFRVNDKVALEKAMDEIDKLEKTTIESDVWLGWNERFPPLLSASAILAFLAVAASMASVRRMA